MLYQQGRQEIRITVRGEYAVGGQQTSDKSPKKEEAGNEEISTVSTSKSRMVKVNTTHAIAIGMQVVNQTANYITSGIGAVGGDSNYQDIVQRKVEILQDVEQVGSGIVMGAVYGSTGGPIGSLIGATFGAVSGLVSKGIKYAGREREYKAKVFKENNAIEYNRARAGINLTTGRLR